MAGLQHNQVFGAPVPESSAIGLEYSRAATAADSYFELLDKHNIQSWTENQVAYLGGLAHFSIGNYECAAQLFSRLDPGYRRDVFIAERFALNPEFSSPTQPGISKLLFVAKLKALPEKPADAFAALQSITREALSTLEAQREYAHWLANRKSIHDRRMFSEGNFGSEPDQRRAEALPPTLLLVGQAWDKLVEPSLRSGAKPVRDYLRTLSTPGAPLEKIALWRLQNLDRLIITAALKDAEQRIARHDFDGGRGILRSLILDYPNSEAAARAQAAIKASVPVAVAHYKAEGERHFRVGDPAQFGKPQTQSREFFERMFKEDVDGPQADHALYWWGRGLGTEGKPDQALAQYAMLLKKFPNSKWVPHALFATGFIYGANFNRHYDKAIATMMQIVEKYPQNEKAPLALWYCAFWRAYGQERYTDATPFLEKLRKYPDSIYAKQIDTELEKYSKWIKEGRGS